MPACGDATYRSCRQATDVRVGHGGPVTGCPLVAPLPTEQVDVVLDLVEDVAEATASWAQAGRIALTDALAAVVVSDVLPARHYLVLTSPLVVADV